MLFDLVFTVRRLYAAEPDMFENLSVPDGMDKQALIDTIIAECRDFGFSPRIAEAKEAITNWSKSREYTIRKLWETVTAEYNPLDNYDRYEDTTDTTAGTASNTSKSAGYNETTLKVDGGADASSSGSSTRISHIHGNIGVTTAAQMLTAERQLAAFSVYKQIARIFADDLCVKIFF